MDSRDFTKNGWKKLAPLNFNLLKGRELTSIVDKKGRVYRPNPYDMPQEPFKVLAFALNHILAMIDTDLIKVDSKGLFLTDKELVEYREKTVDFLRNLESFTISGVEIEYQQK